MFLKLYQIKVLTARTRGPGPGCQRIPPVGVGLRPAGGRAASWPANTGPEQATMIYGVTQKSAFLSQHYVHALRLPLVFSMGQNLQFYTRAKAFVFD